KLSHALSKSLSCASNRDPPHPLFPEMTSEKPLNLAHVVPPRPVNIANEYALSHSMPTSGNPFSTKQLNYKLEVADRLADEHVLIGLYVNLLQNSPRARHTASRPIPTPIHSESAGTTPTHTPQDSLMGVGGDVQEAFSQGPRRNLRNDLLIAADSITNTMSSLVKELNSDGGSEMDSLLDSDFGGSDLLAPTATDPFFTQIRYEMELDAQLEAQLRAEELMKRTPEPEKACLIKAVGEETTEEEEGGDTAGNDTGVVKTCRMEV
ncbi:hypothetical protein CRUP_007180, partial [Coryphaenoides rupestris]